MSEAAPIKVLIINDDGQYLSGTASRWEFTDDRCRARVFDYLRDHVAEQIETVRRAHGAVWIAVRLDPREAYEFCDRCGARMVCAKAYFDGARFFCADCRRQAPA